MYDPILLPFLFALASACLAVLSLTWRKPPGHPSVPRLLAFSAAMGLWGAMTICLLLPTLPWWLALLPLVVAFTLALDLEPET